MCMEKYEEAKAILNKSIDSILNNAEALSVDNVYKLHEYKHAIDQYKKSPTPTKQITMKP